MHSRTAFQFCVLAALAYVPVLLGAAGCSNPNASVQTNDPELAAYLDLVLPARIEIQRFLTKPVSYAGDGAADGL